MIICHFCTLFLYALFSNKTLFSFPLQIDLWRYANLLGHLWEVVTNHYVVGHFDLMVAAFISISEVGSLIVILLPRSSMNCTCTLYICTCSF